MQNTHKVVVYARKSRKFEEIFRPGRRHSKPMQNLRVQSTAENLIGFVSFPCQAKSFPRIYCLHILQSIEIREDSVIGL